ncbi:MAG: hypothetical protein ACRDL4_11745 [Thermoleophilaceae bacterium]
MEGIVATLACPVGMGLVLFMGRGMRRQDSRSEPSLDDLRAEQRRIAAELDRHGDRPDVKRGVGASS